MAAMDSPQSQPVFCDRFDEQRYEFLRACLPKPPAAMLELCCQDGSTVARLLGEGYEANGVELDPGLIRLARERFPLLGHHLIQGEMLEVFDLVRSPLALACCCGNRLPELDSDEDVASVILQLRDLAWPGGYVVVDFFNVNHLVKSVSAGVSKLEDQPTPSMRRSWKLTESTSLPLQETTEMKLDGKFHRRSRSLLMLNRRRIEELLPEGVQPEFFGGYDGSAWSEDSPWTVVRFRCD